MDPVTFWVSGRKNPHKVKTVTFRPFSRRDMSVKIRSFIENLLSFGEYFQYSCVTSMNENFPR